MDTILKVMNVTKVYHTGQNPSLHEVSFEVARGEFIGIMGASGSGKTTLLNILSTIDKPTSGEVLIDGVSLKSLSDSKAADFRRDNLGFIFQDFNLLDTLTACRDLHSTEQEVKAQRIGRILRIVHRIERTLP